MYQAIKADIKVLRDQVSGLQTVEMFLDSAVTKSRRGMDEVCNEVCINGSFSRLFINVTDKIVCEIKDQVKLFNEVLDSLTSEDEALRKKINDCLGAEVVNGIQAKINILQASSRKTYSQYEEYRSKTMNASLAPFLVQHRYVRGTGEVYAGKNRNDDASLCTTVCSTQLINRLQVLSGSNELMTVEQAIYYQGKTGKPPYNYSHNSKYVVGGNEYITSIKAKDSTISSQWLCDQLYEHPEGVEYYAHGHAITITDYEVDGNGNMQFYAIDGVGYVDKDGKKHWYEAQRVPIEQTMFYRDNHGSSSNGSEMINHTTCTWVVTAQKIN